MGEYEQLSILLVDDRPENLLAVEMVLKDMGCQVITAASGQEALRVLLKHQFDLALLDVQMPEMDGFELAQLIRKKKEHRDLQIIFLTAISKEQQYVKKGYDVGAVGYLFKPVDVDELKSKVNAARQWCNYQKKMRAVEAKKEAHSMRNEKSRIVGRPVPVSM